MEPKPKERPHTCAYCPRPAAAGNASASGLRWCGVCDQGGRVRKIELNAKGNQ